MPSASPFQSSSNHYGGSRPVSKRASAQNSRRSNRGKTIVSASEITRLLDPRNDTVIFSAQEFNNLKNITMPGSGKVTPVQKPNLTRTQRNNSRKKRMQEYEKNHRQRESELTDAQREEMAEKAQIINNAKQKLDDEKDDVKHMSSMMKYAKCVTIRDAQILEKRQMQQAQAEEDRRLDLMMEVDRIKAIKLQTETDRVRAIERRQGARVIITQIQEREKQRIRQQEIREQEAKVMLEHIRLQEVAAEEKARQKVLAGKRMLREVLHANEAQAAMKLTRKQEALEEDRQIAEYIKQKELREQAAEAEAKRIAADKEKEIARLRSLQEKAQDRQSTIDELRAKRYQEQKDRAARDKQLAAARKKQAVLKDMAQAREDQMRMKLEKMSAQALLEREEYYRVLDHQRAKIAQDDEIKAQQSRARIQHREALLEQINEHETAKSQARARFLDEGARVAQARASEVKRLEKVKASKIAEMKAAGVPDKYLSELHRKRVCMHI